MLGNTPRVSLKGKAAKGTLRLPWRSLGMPEAYMLGHSPAESRRLIEQAELLAPITRRFLLAAGIRPGMRVLDVGSGMGDVAFLVADLVGPDGEVVGIDTSTGAVAAASARSASLAPAKISFVAGDP